MSLSLGVVILQVHSGWTAARRAPINKLSNARTSNAYMVCSMDTVPKKLERGRAAQGFA